MVDFLFERFKQSDAARTDFSQNLHRPTVQKGERAAVCCCHFFAKLSPNTTHLICKQVASGGLIDVHSFGPAGYVVLEHAPSLVGCSTESAAAQVGPTPLRLSYIDRFIVLPSRHKLRESRSSHVVAPCLCSVHTSGFGRCSSASPVRAAHRYWLVETLIRIQHKDE